MNSLRIDDLNVQRALITRARYRLKGEYTMDEKLKRYQGIFPAFYACYDDTGRVSTSRTKSLAKHLLAKGVTGLYVGVIPDRGEAGEAG